MRAGVPSQPPPPLPQMVGNAAEPEGSTVLRNAPPAAAAAAASATCDVRHSALGRTTDGGSAPLSMPPPAAAAEGERSSTRVSAPQPRLPHSGATFSLMSAAAPAGSSPAAVAAAPPPSQPRSSRASSHLRSAIVRLLEALAGTRGARTPNSLTTRARRPSSTRGAGAVAAPVPAPTAVRAGIAGAGADAAAASATSAMRALWRVARVPRSFRGRVARPFLGSPAAATGAPTPSAALTERALVLRPRPPGLACCGSARIGVDGRWCEGGGKAGKGRKPAWLAKTCQAGYRAMASELVRWPGEWPVAAQPCRSADPAGCRP
eukprot:65863-Chlamydomonas_euryale.AAC.1